MFCYFSVVFRSYHYDMPRYLLSHRLRINPSGLTNDHLIISTLQQLSMYKKTVMQEPHIVEEWSLFN